MFVHSPIAARLALRATAVVLGDLILGLASFSMITSASLWIFSIGWIRLHGEYAAIGQVFGTPAQLELAWIGVFAGLPSLGTSAYLGFAALRVPVGLFRRARAI